MTFPQLKGHVYLDHAGTPPCPASLIKKYTQYLTETLLGNPHSAGSLSANETFTQIQSIRQQVLNHFDAQDYHLIFTSGATEAIRLVGEMFQRPFYYLFDSHTSIVGLTQLMPTSMCLSVEDMKTITPPAGSLISFPAQSNFNGRRFPLDWISRLEPESHVLLDAASLVSTHRLNLSQHQPSFVVLSFYKMFGFPTGLGALFIKKSVIYKLNPIYFGGGTVNAVGVDQNLCYFQWRHGIEQRLERGTIAFQQIVALKFGFELIEQEMGGWKVFEERTMSLAQKTRQAMRQLCHENGAPMVLLYDSLGENYGPIITFQLLFPNGSLVGYSEVMTLASLHQIHLRTGCFCNPGACQYYLGLSLNDIKYHSEVHGHVCWDGKDLINGKPTGAVRISFGMASTEKDVSLWMSFLKEYFKSIPIDLSSPVEKDYRLMSITVFPIKSCGGMTVHQWPVAENGLLYDRCLALMDSNGRLLTQKRYPKMGCISISDWHLDSDSLTLTLNAPEHSNISIMVPSMAKENFPLDITVPGCKSW
jgi:molybdenum cofactor sulfurtransferase